MYKNISDFRTLAFQHEMKCFRKNVDMSVRQKAANYIRDTFQTKTKWLPGTTVKVSRRTVAGSARCSITPTAQYFIKLH